MPNERRTDKPQSRRVADQVQATLDGLGISRREFADRIEAATGSRPTDMALWRWLSGDTWLVEVREMVTTDPADPLLRMARALNPDDPEKARRLAAYWASHAAEGEAEADTDTETPPE